MKLPSSLLALLGEVRLRLEERFPGRVQRLTLFGSAARGEAHEDSDLDVLIILDPLTFPERAAAIEVAAEVGFDRDQVVGPLVLSSAEWAELGRRELLRTEIERDGVDA